MQGWIRLVFLCVLALPLCVWGQSPQPGRPALSPEAQRLRDQAAAIVDAGGNDRSAGTQGAAQAADLLYSKLQAIASTANGKVWRQKHTLVVPRTEQCEARDSEGTSLAIAPLLPMGGQAAAIEGGEATAALVYAGSGTLAEIRGKQIAGNWIAIEITGEAPAWQTMASLGARGVIFLGSAKTPVQRFLERHSSVPVALPRFYCDAGESVERIRTGKVQQLTVRTQTRWVETQVENLLCLLPGRQITWDLPGSSKARGWANQVVVLQARYDASSLVMGRAPGAEQAASPAIALDLARDIATVPDHCSVLVALTAGDEWHFRGTRALGALIRPEIKDSAKAAAALDEDHAALQQQHAAALKLITSLERVAAGDFSALSDPATKRVVRDELDRVASAVEVRLERARLAGTDRSEPETQKALLVRADGAVQGYSPIAGNEAAIADAAGAALPIWRKELDRRAKARDAHAEWPVIRRALGNPPLVHFEVALTSHGTKFGFFARSHYSSQSDFTGKMGDFGTGLRRYWADAGSPARFDPDSTTGKFPLSRFFPTRRAFSSDAALMRGQAAGALATTQDASGIVDTPGDTLDRVNFESLAAQSRDIVAMLVGHTWRPGALIDPLFYGRSDIPNTLADQPVRLLERTIGETTPRLSAPGVLVGGEVEKDREGPGGAPPPLQGTRRFDWYLSHPFVGLKNDEASVILRDVPRVEMRLHALDFAADGMPVRCIVENQNDQQGLVHSVTPGSGKPIRTMLFECKRLSLYGLFDPRYMEYLDRIDLLDARRLDKAAYTNTFVRDGVAAVFMQPELRWQLLVSKGDVSNRMVVINAAAEDPKKPESRGFATTDLAEIGPLPWRTASDLFALNSGRRANLAQYGITNQVIDELHGRSKERLDAANAARDARDYEGWLGNASAAWSLQEQVYSALIATSNGIIKGVIFLLLGVIPFSYFLERLVIGATNVYKQIGWFAGIFLVMTAALLGHPAFRISTAPLMILLAFLILILSSTVVYILWGKFEEEIARLRGAGSAAHSTSLRRGAVFGAAVRLGLSNMRRRGMRTTLTLITLVLLTFTLLCFTSVRETLTLTPRPVADAPAGMPPGILLRQRGWRVLPGDAIQTARQIAGDGGLVSERWWYASDRADQRWALPIASATVAKFDVAALVGIDKNEEAFQPADLSEILPGWSRLAQGERVCFLPETAQGSGLHVGDTIRLVGVRLEIAGFFSPEKFLQLRHLTGDEFTPVDTAASDSFSMTTPTGEEQTALPETTPRFLLPTSVAIVPAGVARDLGGRLTSLMIRPADAATITQTAEALARRSAFTVYVSDGQRTLGLNSVESLRPQNLDKVLIPILIAGVIVLNTMLGAVSERTREIHVYTSVGLAPAHVGMLFLAEAAALGTLGVVFGYIFGQGLATVLSHTRLMSGIDLNYSSMAAIFTMSLVLALVMLSAIWPARAAARVAAPSLERHWKLPPAQGDLLKVDLPFTVNESAARGVCGFLEEFLVAASHAGTSRFSADHIRAFEGQNAKGQTIRGLACKVWLAPYDLGVIENFWLAIHPSSDPQIFTVHLTIQREAGSPSTWHRLNRPFLVEIRKQFLLWRSVPGELVAQYTARTDSLFAAADTQLPPTRSRVLTEKAEKEGAS